MIANSPTITGMQGVDRNLIRSTAQVFAFTVTTGALYQGYDTCWQETNRFPQTFSLSNLAPTILTLSITDTIISNTELMSSLDRAIQRLEPGKLLTDKDVFGEEADNDQ